MRTYKEEELIKELYRTSDDMKDYVERYAYCQHISIDEALTHQIVLEKAKDIKTRMIK